MMESLALITEQESNHRWRLKVDLASASESCNQLEGGDFRQHWVYSKE